MAKASNSPGLPTVVIISATCSLNQTTLCLDSPLAIPANLRRFTEGLNLWKPLIVLSINCYCVIRRLVLFFWSTIDLSLFFQVWWCSIKRIFFLSVNDSLLWLLGVIDSDVDHVDEEDESDDCYAYLLQFGERLFEKKEVSP